MPKLINMPKFLQTVLFITGIVLSSIVFSTSAFAGAGCVPVYGGGVQCPRVGQVLINKTVRNPSTGVFVDNLGPADPKYRPLWTVTFRIIINNSGDQSLDKVTVTDKLPAYLDFMSGPGTYDSKNRTLTFDVYNLSGGTSQSFEVKARVSSVALPSDKTVVCPVNVVDAVVGSQTDHDESQFCIEKQLIVPTVPKAGPENWMLSIVGLIASLKAGLFLRRKSINIFNG